MGQKESPIRDGGRAYDVIYAANQFKLSENTFSFGQKNFLPVVFFNTLTEHGLAVDLLYQSDRADNIHYAEYFLAIAVTALECSKGFFAEEREKANYERSEKTFNGQGSEEVEKQLAKIRDMLSKQKKD